MDFNFIGGSMGSVVGEKIIKPLITIKNHLPLVIISRSGGARMMQSANLWMAKTSAKLAELSETKLPYISLCTDPTTGGQLPHLQQEGYKHYETRSTNCFCWSKGS